MSHHGALINKTTEYNKDNYFTDLWGPVAATENEILISQQSMAPKILNKSYFYFQQKANNDRVLEAATEKNTQAFKYLNLFESLRLGNKMTKEDNKFAKVIELMMVDWIKSTDIQEESVSHMAKSLKKLFRRMKKAYKNGNCGKGNSSASLSSDISGEDPTDHAQALNSSTRGKNGGSSSSGKNSIGK